MRNYAGETYLYPQTKSSKPKPKRRERPVIAPCMDYDAPPMT
jgi:hypothetical protein